MVLNIHAVLCSPSMVKQADGTSEEGTERPALTGAHGIYAVNLYIILMGQTVKQSSVSVFLSIRFQRGVATELHFRAGDIVKKF